MKKINLTLLPLAIITLLISGCATTAEERVLDLNENQLKLRSIQTRAFDTNDKEKMMRSVMATLQDLDFVVNKADYDLGIVTGTKFINNQVLKMTVIVREKDKSQLLVRANAQYGIKAISSPNTYQDFFDALSKSIFLTAQQID
ncbi:MAG: hypothetical protein FJZ12_02685 [Candidatus Omnitrophica bacterium]|nr:hypothetical protein [Candidatus Omnitrophota bacterium]